MAAITAALTALVTVAAAAASPAKAVVWQAASAAGSLAVFEDHSYAVAAAGETTPWLASGPSSFHVAGVWYTSASAAPAATCVEYADTDCHGDDLFFFNSTSAAPCCANCSGTPACGAWTWTGVTAGESKGEGAGGGAGAPPEWAYRCYIKADCSGRQSYAGHTSGLAPSATAQPLTFVSAGSSPDGVGWQLKYFANTTPVTLSFGVDNATGAFLFAQSFPSGATGINVTAPLNSSSSSTPSSPFTTGEFASSMVPSTQFPVFVEAPGSPSSARLGFVTWSGRFYHSSSASGGGAGAAFAVAAQGAEGGPIVLFDAMSDSALVMSPLDHFKSTILGGAPLVGAGAAAAGVNGYVTDLPAGFRSTTVLVFGGAGVTDAVHAWGDALQSAYKSSKIADPSASSLSYWTDNGAYYDFYAYEPDITSKGVPQDVLIALSETFRNGSYPGPRVPVVSFMLDAYWMFNTRQNGNCKMNDSAWPLPFPKGLAWLSQAVGAGLIIYNGPQCSNTTYAGEWPLEYSLFWDQGWGSGTLSAVAAASSRAFYDATFTALQQQGLLSFTQDFLDFQGLLFPGFLADPDGNAGWMRGQAAAALAANVAVQYCMALPADILQSVEFDAVTNARASDDYGAGGENWRIGGSSLLLSALGLRGSKDNFWSSSVMTDRGQETSPFLQAVVCALSGGPVGFADRLFDTNVAALWPTMSLNGTLLHASRPATAIDAQFTKNGSLASGEVWAAHAAIATGESGNAPMLFFSVLAAGLAPGSVAAALRPRDLWPTPGSVPYFLYQHNNSACATHGGPGAACVAVLGVPSANTPRPAPSVPDKTQWELWWVTPALANIVLLGEVSKFVAVSPDRFTYVAASGNGLLVKLVGAPLEVVNVAFLNMGSGGAYGMVNVQSLTLGSDGRLSYLLHSAL